MSILPSARDRYRYKANGKRRYVGQVLGYNGARNFVVAEVYGDTLKLMRQRKQACFKALAEIENTQ